MDGKVLNNGKQSDGMRHPYNLNHPQGIPSHLNTQENNLMSSYSHTHSFYEQTSLEHHHLHLLPTVTSTSIQTSEGHVHKIVGTTTFAEGHIHSFQTYTSPPIHLSNGYHTHFVNMKTTSTNNHDHVIEGFVAPIKARKE